LNLYAYALGDPVGVADLQGKRPFHWYFERRLENIARDFPDYYIENMGRCQLDCLIDYLKGGAKTNAALLTLAELKILAKEAAKSASKMLSYYSYLQLTICMTRCCADE